MSNFTGPLTRDEYEDAFQRRDKRTLTQLLAEEDKIVAAEAAEFDDAEKEAIAAASAAWVPVTPRYIDAHFSLWSLPKGTGLGDDIYEGVRLPGYQEKGKWRGVTSKATARLHRDFKPDDYEEELFEMKQRANAELKANIGELSPVQYAIHVQSTPTYHENMVISSMAEEYYYIAGHIGWADIHDPSFRDRLRSLMFDPFLVGLRYDLTNTDGDVLLDQEVDANFAAIEQHGVPFDLMIGPHQLKHACHLAYKHPKLKLVLNHCGMPMELTSIKPENEIGLSTWQNDVEYLSRYPNVYCKLTATSGKLVLQSHSDGDETASAQTASGGDDKRTTESEKTWLPLAVLEHAVACFGPDRCMFGSGWPVCRVVAPAQTGWKDSGTGGFLFASGRTKFPAVGRGPSVAASELSVWEAARLVENALENRGFGAIEDKRKVFASVAQSVYTLNIRPYGSSRVL